MRYLLIAVGGALGALLRYSIGVAAGERFGARFPIGTLAINLSACFMIGFVLEFLDRRAGINPAWRYALAVGFVGSFSTFSTFAWETWADLRGGAFWIGMVYVAVSVIVGLLMVGAGSLSARSLA